MGNKVISLDLEAEEIWQSKKDENPDFNFSQFVQDALKNVKVKPKLTYEQVLEKQRNFQVKLTEIDGEMNYLDSERRKMELEIQQEKDNKLQQEMREAKKIKDRMDGRVNTFMFFYKGIDKATATELAEEFDPISKDKSQTMYQFLDGKGYVQRTADEMDELEEKQKNGK